MIMRSSEFFQLFKGPVIASCEHTPLLPSVIMAHAIVSTSFMSVPKHNNMFNVRSEGVISPFWHGSVIRSKVKTFFLGQQSVKPVLFRDYDCVSDSLYDFVYMIHNDSRYSAVMRSYNVFAQVEALYLSGIEADQGYPSRIFHAIEMYNLDVLDTFHHGEAC